MTIREVIQNAVLELEARDITSAQIDAEILLAHSLKVDRSSLFIDSDLEIDTKIFDEYLKRRCKAEPVSYIIDSREFYGRDFYVDKRVLIPRPETEILIEEVIKYSKSLNHEEIKIVDLGTGSGNIGITLSLEIEKSQVLGLDNSSGAIEVAQKNSSLLNASNITFVKSDFFHEVNLYNVDILVANLPYVPLTEKKVMLSDVLNFEPKTALFSGKDGLDHYRKLIKTIKKSNINVGALFIEIFHTQGHSIEELFVSAFPNIKVSVINDLGGFNRVVKLLDL